MAARGGSREKTPRVASRLARFDAPLGHAAVLPESSRIIAILTSLATACSFAIIPGCTCERTTKDERRGMESTSHRRSRCRARLDFEGRNGHEQASVDGVEDDATRIYKNFDFHNLPKKRPIYFRRSTRTPRRPRGGRTRPARAGGLALWAGGVAVGGRVIGRPPPRHRERAQIVLISPGQGLGRAVLVGGPLPPHGSRARCLAEPLPHRLARRSTAGSPVAGGSTAALHGRRPGRYCLCGNQTFTARGRSANEGLSSRSPSSPAHAS